MNYLQLPDHVYKAKMSGLELLIYADVWTMQQVGKPYWKSNATIAKQFKSRRTSVLRSIAKLESMGFLHRVEKGEGSRFLEALIPDFGSLQKETSLRAETSLQMESGSLQMETGVVSKMHSGSLQMETQVENIREKKKKEDKRENSTELVFPWESVAFLDAWNRWKEYKQTHHRFKYKNNKSEQIALHQLHRDTNGSERQAIDAIGRSITNGYKGLFPKPDANGVKSGKLHSWAQSVVDEYASGNENISSKHE